MKQLILAVVVLIAVIALFAWLKVNGSHSLFNPSGSNLTASKSATISSGVTPLPGQIIITVTANGFVPETITVKKNSQVVWVNRSNTIVSLNSQPYPKNTNYPPLNLGQFGNGQSISLIFDKLGTYGYYNYLNQSQKGTVIVN